MIPVEVEQDDGDRQKTAGRVLLAKHAGQQLGPVLELGHDIPEYRIEDREEESELNLVVRRGNHEIFG